MLADHFRDIEALSNRLDELGRHLDLPKRRQELAALEQQSSEPTLWDDPTAAQKLMQRLSGAKADLEPFDVLRSSVDDVQVLYELAQEDDNPDGYETEVVKAIQDIETGLDSLEVKTLLAGTYDSVDAILEVKPGAGGTEACDWAAMLLRMYVRWAEDNGFKAEIHEELPGEVAGLSFATVFISGRNAYGFLKSEHGVHRLVRISPFNANGKRQTSFAAVEVMPQVESDTDVEIRAEDIRLDTYRASGAGGQHVNKTSSAVRITHIPSGIVVQCQNERSQLQNKELAMHMLRGKLAEMKARQEEAKLAAIRGTQLNIEWGSQIRSYVFQPYTLVKDVRTKASVGDVQKVMDGYLEPFMTAYLRYIAGKGTSGDDSNDDMDA
ncbi:MAG: peptide chain release factor 2 [Armatimonadaceae bacterium]